MRSKILYVKEPEGDDSAAGGEGGRGEDKLREIEGGETGESARNKEIQKEQMERWEGSVKGLLEGRKEVLAMV